MMGFLNFLRPKNESPKKHHQESPEVLAILEKIKQDIKDTQPSPELAERIWNSFVAPKVSEKTQAFIEAILEKLEKIRATVGNDEQDKEDEKSMLYKKVEQRIYNLKGDKSEYWEEKDDMVAEIKNNQHSSVPPISLNDFIDELGHLAAKSHQASQDIEELKRLRERL